MSKKYIGIRDQQGNCDIKVETDGQVQSLHHVKMHSPTGFEWGYGGSGPADTALSILCDFFGEKPSPKDLRNGKFHAQNLYQAFKFHFVGRFEKSWELTGEQIAAWIKEKQAAKIAEDQQSEKGSS